jgi:hypothetical protein
MRFRLALLVVVGLVAAGCSSGQQPSHPRSSASSAKSLQAARPTADKSCAAAHVFGPLPTWAQSGFRPPDRPMPHVMGERGTIVAILWARRDALHAPLPANQGNKILWVAREPGAPLTIKATLQGTDRTATLEFPNGTGPSEVNLPAAGCWTLNLSWPGHRDRVELRYVNT